jgi:glycosyltransferase involved in cell wall biosynthesis
MVTSTKKELLRQVESVMRYSIVVPLYNEEENVESLYRELKRVMDSIGEPYELVFVDDGSTDGTYRLLSNLCQADESLLVIRLGRNFGQTAALAAGFDYASGSVIIAMDADLQYDPEDIPLLLEKINQGYDIASGWRKRRTDNLLTRRLPSAVANWIMAKLSGIAMRDFGSTFKAYRSDVIKNVRLYGELHRFIPVLASLWGASIVEVPVQNRPRLRGKSKYGLSRIVRVLLDFITIKFLLSYLTKPLQLFGKYGLVAFLTGLAMGIYMLAKKILYGTDLLEAHGPSLLLSFLLIITGVQLICFGLIGEVLSRTYYESQGKRIYTVKEVRGKKAA